MLVRMNSPGAFWNPFTGGKPHSLRAALTMHAASRFLRAPLFKKGMKALGRSANYL